MIFLEPYRLETDCRSMAVDADFTMNKDVKKKTPPHGGALQEDTDCLFVPAVALRLELVAIVRHEQLSTFDVAHHFQTLQRVGVILNAVVQARGITVEVFLHPDSVL